MRKSHCIRKKCKCNYTITIPKHLQLFFLDSFNANFRKQRERITNEISNPREDANQNLDIKGLKDLRKLYTSNLVIGYLNINGLRNKIAQLRKVWRKAKIDLL